MRAPDTIATATARPALGALREPLVALAAALAAIGFVFADTFAKLAQTWDASASFTHGWIIAPLSLWMAWRRRADLARCEFRPFWPAALGLVACGFAWLVGRLGGVNAAEQFAVVAMIQFAVALLLGRDAYRTILFPMAFLFFAVPFGDFLLPRLMDWTATFVVAGVRASGVPVLREGQTIQLPTGTWSVIDACSGLRYLLAALPISCIYAYLTYRTLRSRALFVVTVLVVALVANWLRAYGIVMLGHLSDMKIAVGVDHIIYGWIFFGVVMALAFWIGSFWEDPPDHARARPGDGSVHADEAGAAENPRATPATRAPRAALVASAVIAVAAIAFWPHVARALAGAGEPTVRLAPIRAAVTEIPGPAGKWAYRPLYGGGVGEVFGRSHAQAGVEVLVAHYLHQKASGEMITWGNRIVPGDPEHTPWRVVDEHPYAPAATGAAFPAAPVNEYVIAGPSGRYLVWEWFWVNGESMTDLRRIKLETAFDLLRGRGDESLAWFLWTPLDDGVPAARSRIAVAANALEPAARAAGAR